MNVSFDFVKHILDTLPIGYYLGRNIPVTLDKGLNSYFNPIANHITIGYGLIAESFSKVTEEKYNVDVEEVVRGLLYHEISHVVLTPTALLKVGGNKEIINIFEDERIETLLAKTYMNTNFKKNIIFLNDYDGTTEPKNAIEAFYHVVRYHRGKQKYIDRVAHIIKQYAHINKMYGETIGSSYSNEYKRREEISIVKSYAQAIMALYEDIAKDFENNQNNQSQNNDQNNDSNDQSQDNNQLNDQSQSNDQSEDQNENNQSNSSNNESNESDKNNESNGSNENNDSDDNDSNENSTSSSKNNDDEDNNNENSNNSNANDINDDVKDTDTDADTDNADTDTDADDYDDNSLTDDQVDDLIKNIDVQMSDEELKSIFKDAINSVIEILNDTELSARLKKIIDEKLKEDDKNGAAISAYSGRFDPRALARRDDYKWWNQQNVNGDIRRFSKVHFNLFIDNSGSFANNDINMNKFIQALNKIVSRDFDFDVVTINTRVVEWPDTTSKMFSSEGCNSLHSNIAQVVRKHTQSQANNYNIILFDGDANPDHYNDGTNAFKYLDGPNTILVTDHQNEKYVNKAMRQAKVIVTNNYCDEFIDTVCRLLERVM